MHCCGGISSTRSLSDSWLTTRSTPGSTSDSPGLSWRLYLPSRSTSIERLLLVTFTLLMPTAASTARTGKITNSMPNSSRTTT